MPVQADATRVQAASEAFKETTAAFRKTGPVEKYQPLSENIRKLALNGLAPIAPRVAELEREGKKISIATIRTAEVAAKLQKGEALTPSEVAQAYISVREALDTGLNDHDSPYYQATTTLRTQRENELALLHDELNAYLTGEARKPYDTTEVITRRRWTRRGPSIPMPFGWARQQIFPIYPGRESYNVNETRTITPGSDEALTPAAIAAAKRQSRVLEAYNNSRERIAQQRHGTNFSGITDSRERRMVIYDASDEVAYKFADEEAVKILEEAKQGPKKDDLKTAIEEGSPAEKALAKKYQKLGLEGIPSMFRHSKDLAKIRNMAEFQRFLGVDDIMLSKAEIVDAIAEHLGITDERELRRLRANPNKAYERLYGESGEFDTILFADKLFRDKLEKLAQDREEPATAQPERPTGQAPIEITKDGLIGLSPEGIALRLADGKLTKNPLEYLKNLGVPEAQAQQMISDAEKFLNKKGDTYFINEDTYGVWDNKDLAVLLREQSFDFTDPTKVAELQKKLEDSLKKQKVGNPADRAKMAADKINAIKELLQIENGALSKADQEKILAKWGDKRSLALLALFLGMIFTTRVINLMPDHEARGFQNMFA